MNDWAASPKGKAFVATAALGFAGLVIGPAFFWTALERVHLEHIWLEVFAAFFILGSVEIVLRMLEARLESQELKDFSRFFGDCSVTAAHIIFPTASPYVDEHGLCKVDYPSPPAVATGFQAKGIRHIVPYEDLRAALALSQLFERMRGSLDMSLDFHYQVEAEPLPNVPLIAVGLGFNHVTARLATLCPDLFAIVFNDGSDDFVFAGHPHGYPVNGTDCAMVVRVVNGSRHSPQLICAGRSAGGTAAAGIYLAQNWKVLVAEYDRARKNLDEDSLAVLISFKTHAFDSGRCEKTCFQRIQTMA